VPEDGKSHGASEDGQLHRQVDGEAGGPSEDDRFFTQLTAVIKRFPAKSVAVLVSAVMVLGGAGWWAAMLLRPPLVPEREAARSAFRTHGLEVPPTTDVVALIDKLSESLGPKIDVSVNPATDIGGNWEYKCVALDRKYSHGGSLSIEMQMTAYGPQWRLTGTRKWREKDGKREDNLNYNWTTDWAAVTEKDRIKYTYRITTDKGIVIGFADGAITERDAGRPTKIAGTFYQLPPLDPMYGNYEFTRD
jgi:hypothetical protein